MADIGEITHAFSVVAGKRTYELIYLGSIEERFEAERQATAAGESFQAVLDDTDRKLVNLRTLPNEGFSLMTTITWFKDVFFNLVYVTKGTDRYLVRRQLAAA